MSPTPNDQPNPYQSPSVATPAFSASSEAGLHLFKVLKDFRSQIVALGAFWIFIGAVAALVGLMAARAGFGNEVAQGQGNVALVVLMIAGLICVAGVLVFDIDNGHKLVKRIETPASREEKPDNIKGVCACAATQRLYLTTTKKIYFVDLASEQTLWEKSPPNGTDRMSITPDGKIIYVPSFEKDTWNVLDATTGNLIREIETKSGAHNTVVSRDGQRMYLGGLKSPLLFVADVKTHEIVQKVGPFAGAIRPFTVNGKRSRAYICVNDCLGFEIGDLTTDKRLYRIEVQGFERGPVKRHGCPSHGIGLTPDEKEV